MKLNRYDTLITRTVKSFSDLLILKYLKTHPLSSGYEILRHLGGKYNIRFSPGTIYHELYLLERKKAIESEGDDNGRTYSLTVEGEKTLAAMFQDGAQIQQLIATIFSEA